MRDCKAMQLTKMMSMAAASSSIAESPELQGIKSSFFVLNRIHENILSPFLISFIIFLYILLKILEISDNMSNVDVDQNKTASQNFEYNSEGFFQISGSPEKINRNIPIQNYLHQDALTQSQKDLLIQSRQVIFNAQVRKNILFDKERNKKKVYQT